jgi:hypothetical protein
MPSPRQNPDDLDIASYGSPLRLNARHGLVLARQLVVSAPEGLTGRPRAALTKVETASAGVIQVLGRRERGSPGGLRPVILELDSAYGALHGRLASAARLPAVAGDLGARARAILGAILPDGTAFLVCDVRTKFAESQRRIEMIEEDALEREIGLVAGAPFFAELKRTHAALAEAIGAGVTPVRFERAELQLAVRRLTDAIAHYCLQLAALVDPDDPRSLAAFRAAVTPIDRFRADRGTSAGDDDEPETPETPAA